MYVQENTCIIAIPFIFAGREEVKTYFSKYILKLFM